MTCLVAVPWAGPQFELNQNRALTVYAMSGLVAMAASVEERASSGILIGLQSIWCLSEVIVLWWVQTWGSWGWDKCGSQPFHIVLTHLCWNLEATQTFQYTLQPSTWWLNTIRHLISTCYDWCCTGQWVPDHVSQVSWEAEWRYGGWDISCQSSGYHFLQMWEIQASMLQAEGGEGLRDVSQVWFTDWGTWTVPPTGSLYTWVTWNMEMVQGGEWIEMCVGTLPISYCQPSQRSPSLCWR